MTEAGARGNALDAFFLSMGELFAGTITADELERRHGPSASGTKRLALYKTLVERQKRGVLDHFFASVRIASRLTSPSRWEQLVTRFLETHTPAHWEPNQFALQMLAYLQGSPEQECGGLPPYLVELADHACTRFSAMSAAAPAGREAGIERRLFVRQYTHAVAEFALTAEKQPWACTQPPPAEGLPILVVRSVRTGRLLTRKPSVTALIALGLRDGVSLPSLPRGLTVHDVRIEDDHLVELGVLRP